MSSEKKQILWVDDEIEFLRSHILFLEEHNYEVAKATNGNDALVLIREKNFDLVFLDEQMPGKDGLTTLEEIKSHSETLPVVMVTKSEEEQLMEEAIGRNISGYLTKPVNPSQILSVVKNILHSKTIKKTHFTSTYVREYAKYKAELLSNPNPQSWSILYQAICKWDLNMQALRDQGLEDTHTNHKKDAAHKFTRFIEHHYLSWFNNRVPNQHLARHALKRKVFPLLKERKDTCLVVMAGFRYDQWLAIRPFVEPFFQTEDSIAWSMLPSERLYSRSSLLSGKTPRELALSHPALWTQLIGSDFRAAELELLKINMFSSGIQDIEKPVIRHIGSRLDSEEVQREWPELEKEKMITLVVEFSELLSTIRKETSLFMEIAADENGLRELTKIWFQSSILFKLMKRCSESGRHLVLASDHGAILVKKPVEVFCQEEKTPHPRLKVGENISCDERHVFFIEAPETYGLPGERETAYALAKEDNYFIYPNRYHFSGTRFKDQVVSGGLSLEELMVPLIALTPKSTGA